LAARTRDAYGQHVGAYGAWLAGRAEPGVAITDPRGRDHAARDFKRHLKVERAWKPSSVNLALAAVDHFNRFFLGLGPANVKREPLAQAAPKAPSEEQQRALLRAAETSRPRDRAIVTLLLITGSSTGGCTRFPRASAPPCGRTPGSPTRPPPSTPPGAKRPSSTPTRSGGERTTSRSLQRRRRATRRERQAPVSKALGDTSQPATRNHL